MMCAPVVDEEKEYVAEPLERASDVVMVVPSTTTVSVPVGVVVMVLDCGATVIVIVSLAPTAGVVVAAVSAVVVACSEAEDPEGQEVSRLYRSTDPSPVASS